jgi:hypothetical protein
VSDDDGFGFGFWAKVAGLIVAAGLIAMILFLIFSRLLYAFGFLGAFLIGALLLLLFGWIYDRRNARAWE